MLYTLFWWSLLGQKQSTARGDSIHCSVIQILLVQVRLRTKVLLIPNSTRPGFELMTSKSWMYISCHWDTCSNHSVISDLPGLFDQIYTNKDKQCGVGQHSKKEVNIHHWLPSAICICGCHLFLLTYGNLNLFISLITQSNLFFVLTYQDNQYELITLVSDFHLSPRGCTLVQCIIFADAHYHQASLCLFQGTHFITVS